MCKGAGDHLICPLPLIAASNTGSIRDAVVLHGITQLSDVTAGPHKVSGVYGDQR